MANNRMWVKCENCGKRMLIGKYFPTGGWEGQDTAKLVWFNTHIHKADIFEGADHFSLEFESKCGFGLPKIDRAFLDSIEIPE